MTLWESMNSSVVELLVSGAMLIMLYAGYLCMAFYRLGKKEINTIISFILFVLYFGAFYLMLDGKFHYMEPDYFYYMDVDYLRTWSKVTTAFCSLPVPVVLALEIITVLYLIRGTKQRIKLRKESLTPTSIKEAIDLLPAGVAFAEMSGNVVFANLSMNVIAQSCFGKSMTDLTGFEHNTICSDGTKTWQFIQENITLQGKNYIQVTANDITEEAGINDELKGKNRKLKEIRNRLEIFNRRAEQITISKELLNARRQVHSETGHILLASRHYMEHPDFVDEEKFLSTLKLTNLHLLKEYEEDDTETDLLSEAMVMAKAINVRVKLVGMIPEEGTLRDILASAINECATNTKKHADGDMLTVTTEEKKDTVIFTLTGNDNLSEKDTTEPGAAPFKTVKETGGLASLRILVENAGGTMEIKTEETFTVIIRIHCPSS